MLLLGTDTPIGLAIVRGLGRHGYPVVGVGRTDSAIAGASRYCVRHEVRSRDEDVLVGELLALARETGAQYLLTISEGDMLMVNRRRSDIEPALEVLVPPPDLLARVLDKATCQRLAEDVGIRVPRTIEPVDLAHGEAAADTVTYPVILKWSDPNAVAADLRAAGLPRHKVQYAEDRDALLGRLRPYAAIGRFPMIQEYCPGHGVGHMFLAVDGEVLIEFQHERLHEWPPEGGFSTLCRAVPLSAFGEARARSRALLSGLRWTGVAMVEYRYDPDAEQWTFLEINGRFWGSLPLAVATAVPFAAGLVAAVGEGTDVPAWRRDYPPRRCLYGIPEARRLLRILFRPGSIPDPAFRVRPLRELAAYVRHLADPTTCYYVWSIDDPKPFFADMGAVIRQGFARLLRR